VPSPSAFSCSSAYSLEGVFVVVIASGALLLHRQNRLPQRIKEEVPEETIAPQIEAGLRFQTAELAQRIDDVCGWSEECQLARAAVGYSTEEERERLPRKPGTARPPAVEVPGSEKVREFFIEEAREYLLVGRSSGSPLASPVAADARFEQLRLDVPEAARAGVRELIAELEKLCNRRRALDRQAELDARLNWWRLVHIPLSALLVALTLAHAATALRFW
jgi:hypothetical protein